VFCLRHLHGEIALFVPRIQISALEYAQRQPVAKSTRNVGGGAARAAIDARVLDGGFLCATAIARDPWFASLHSSVHYVELMREAERKRSEVHAMFLAAGGERLLSVA
jgi:hypothetical protein